MTRQMPEWCADPSEVLRLLRWMHCNDDYGPLEIETVFEVLEKPWHWHDEWLAMERGEGGESIATLLQASIALARGAKGART
jgi:hypothetical protein